MCRVSELSIFCWLVPPTYLLAFGVHFGSRDLSPFQGEPLFFDVSQG